MTDVDFYTTIITLTLIYFCMGYALCYAVNNKKPYIKFKTNKVYQKLPTRATEGSAGHDFYTSTIVSIPPKEMIVFDTNIVADIPEGYVLKMYMRSSIGIKKHLMLANTTSIIDCDYKDTIKAALYNYGDKEVIIKPFERFMQGVCVPYITSKQLPLKKERDGGIGSTGR